MASIGKSTLTKIIHPYVTKANEKFVRAQAVKFGSSYSQFVNALVEKKRTGKRVTINGVAI